MVETKPKREIIELMKLIKKWRRTTMHKPNKRPIKKTFPTPHRGDAA